jgi:hypothetical protein
VDKLLKYVSKAQQIEHFDEELFNRYIARIIVYSQLEIGFERNYSERKAGVVIGASSLRLLN